MTTTAHSAVAEIMNALGDRLTLITEYAQLLNGGHENSLVKVPYQSISIDPPDPSGKPDSRRWFEKPFSEDRSVPLKAFVARLDLDDDDDWKPWMVGHAKHLQVDVDEFKEIRHATVLGQAEITGRKEEIHKRFRRVKGEGEVEGEVNVEGEGKVEGEVEYVAFVAPVERDQAAPSLLVRPLCIYK
jgi:hypothetical protein